MSEHNIIRLEETEEEFKIEEDAIEIKTEEDLEKIKKETERIEANDLSSPKILEKITTIKFKNLEVLSLNGAEITSLDFLINDNFKSLIILELKNNKLTSINNIEKLNNSVIAKLMSVSYNIMQFVLDSALFNKIIHDVFKYCKINEQNRQIVVEMIESQISGENIDYLKLDKDMLLSLDKKEKKEE